MRRKKKQRMKGKQLLQYIKKKLHYDPNTGEFRWRVGFKHIRKGSIAGSPTRDGYWGIRLKGKMYAAHRLAWLWVHGYDSENFIDHKNGNRQDNRACNLREVSPKCNTQNTAKTKRKTTSKYKGVSKKGDKWMAYIEIDGRKKFLGYCDTEFEAACLRLKAEQEEESWSCDIQDHNFQTALEEII